MAKTPAPARNSVGKAKQKARSGQDAASVAGKDMGGESPRKAALFPADAPITQSFAENRGKGGEPRNTVSR